ncbi:MAG: multidrug effflux MFS transporter [Caulobacteraceae bacterium]
MDSSPKPTPAPGFALVVLLGVLTAFPPMSLDLYLPGMPTIAASFGVPPDGAQATMASFLAGLAIGQFFYGPASDRWGRRTPILFGAILYVAASAACAVAPTLDALTAARFVQALGGCAGGVVARAVVRDRFDYRESARVLSLLMLIMGCAPIIAPLVGGFILQVSGWRGIFWLLVVFGAVAAVWTFFGLPESRSAETAATARSEHPVRGYISLLGNRQLVGFTLAQALNSGALFSYMSAAPSLLISTYGIRPDHFGWLFGLNAAGLIGMSQINRRLLRRRTPEEIVLMVRPMSLVCALVLVGTAFTGFGGLVGVLVPLFFCIATLGAMSPNTTAASFNIDPQRAGSISALIGGSSFGVGALCSAVFSNIHHGGPRPLAVAILVCFVGSAVCLYTLALPRAKRVAG